MQKIKHKISGSMKIMVTFLTMMAFSSSFYYAMESYSHKVNTKKKDNDKIKDAIKRIQFIGQYQKDNEKELCKNIMDKHFAYSLKGFTISDLKKSFLDMSTEDKLAKIQEKIYNSVPKQTEIDTLIKDFYEKLPEDYKKNLKEYSHVEQFYYHGLQNLTNKIITLQNNNNNNNIQHQEQINQNNNNNNILNEIIQTQEQINQNNNNHDHPNVITDKPGNNQQ